MPSIWAINTPQTNYFPRGVELLRRDVFREATRRQAVVSSVFNSAIAGITAKARFAMAENETLFERLGGEPRLEKLVVQFYRRVLADPRLMPFFEKTSVDKLVRMQREFFAAAFDGPQTYSGLALTRAHAGRGITPEDFSYFAGHLLTTLEENGVTPEDVREVVHRIAMCKNDITGESY